MFLGEGSKLHGAGHGGGYTLTTIGPTEAIIAGSDLVPTEIGKADGRELTTTVIDATKDESALTTEIRRRGVILWADNVVTIVISTGVFDDVIIWGSR